MSDQRADECADRTVMLDVTSLGLHPYVVVELVSIERDEHGTIEHIDVGVRCGGGVAPTDVSLLLNLVLHAVESGNYNVVERPTVSDEDDKS